MFNDFQNAEQKRAHERLEKHFSVEIMDHVVFNGTECEGIDISEGGIRFSADRDITFFKNLVLKVKITSELGDYFIDMVQIRSVVHKKGRTLYGCSIKAISDNFRGMHSQLINWDSNEDKMLNLDNLDEIQDKDVPVKTIEPVKEINQTHLSPNELLLIVENQNTMISALCSHESSLSLEELKFEIQIIITNTRKALM